MVWQLLVPALVALLLLVDATIFPGLLTLLAGVTFAVSSMLLWVNLLNATRIYWRELKR